jgi:hypothetical protein
MLPEHWWLTSDTFSGVWARKSFQHRHWLPVPSFAYEGGDSACTVWFQAGCGGCTGFTEGIL